MKNYRPYFRKVIQSHYAGSTLHNRLAGYEHIREILLTIANDYVQPKNRFAAAA